jgi:predicted nucleic acid-binding protein
MILVDSSVLIDVIAAKDVRWADWSEAQLLKAGGRDELAINLMVYAEISSNFAAKSSLDSFLGDLGIRLDGMSPDIAFAAATAHCAYRKAGGLRSATLHDFFIGAHAATKNFPLLTRDPVRVRTYFPQVLLITPE